MLTAEPARMEDIGRLFTALPRKYWRGLVVQMARSVALAIEEDGELLAIVGLYPDPPNLFELWLCIAPDIRGGRKAVRLARELVHLSSGLPDGVPVALSVKEGHGPGMRLARLAGFREVGEIATAGGRLVRFLRG